MKYILLLLILVMTSGVYAYNYTIDVDDVEATIIWNNKTMSGPSKEVFCDSIWEITGTYVTNESKFGALEKNWVPETCPNEEYNTYIKSHFDEMLDEQVNNEFFVPLISSDSQSISLQEQITQLEEENSILKQALCYLDSSFGFCT